MGIAIKKQFTDYGIRYAKEANADLSSLSISKLDNSALIYYYEISLAHGLTQLATAIEQEMYKRDMNEYIVPRQLFTQLNPSMFSIPFAKMVLETRPLGINILLQDCADRYSPPSFGWMVGYVMALSFDKPEVAEKLAEKIKQIETVALCMPAFMTLVANMPDIHERLAHLHSLVQNSQRRRATRDVQEDIDMQEDIEKHEELNPILFENNKLKPEIRDKALEVADELLSMISDVGLEIDLKDIIITGSNASYNYTKDSDIDLHLVADLSKVEDPEGLYPILFNSFKSAFNKKYNVTFYDIPVEVYIESEDTTAVSNGIYSVKQDAWVQEPKNEQIPDIDLEALDLQLQPWIDQCKQLIQDIKDKKVTSEKAIDEYVDKLYQAREKGLHGEGGNEYSIENLVFKEIRNLGYLDQLKELRDQVISNRLSLEEWLENPKARLNLQTKIQQLTHYQPIIQLNGIFEIYNVPEQEVAYVLNILRRQEFVEHVHASPSRYDFSRLGMGGRPSQKHNIHGQLKV